MVRRWPWKAAVASRVEAGIRLESACGMRLGSYSKLLRERKPSSRPCSLTAQGRPTSAAKDLLSTTEEPRTSEAPFSLLLNTRSLHPPVGQLTPKESSAALGAGLASGTEHIGRNTHSLIVSHSGESPRRLAQEEAAKVSMASRGPPV